MAHVRTARSGKGYEVRYRDHGGKERSRTFRLKVHAKAFAADAEVARYRGDAVDRGRGSRTFGEHAATWMAVERDWKPKTAVNYESLMRTWLLPTFKTVRLARIGHSEVDAWVGSMRAAKLSNSRIKQAFGLMYQVLEAAKHDKVFTQNPAAGIKVGPGPKTEMTFLSAIEVERLVRAMPAPWHLIALIQVYGGLRIGEVMALTSGRCLLGEKRLHVVKSVGEAGGRQYVTDTKNHKRRFADIPPFMVDLIAEHLASLGDASPEAYLFADRNGSPMRYSNFYNRQWKPALKSAAMAHIGTHVLRHTFVALAWNAGNDELTISRQMGHSSVAFTHDRYGHIFESKRDGLRASMEAVRAEAVRLFTEFLDDAEAA